MSASTAELEELGAEFARSSDVTADHWWWQQRDELEDLHRIATASGANPTAALVAVIAKVIAQTPSRVHLPAIIGRSRGSLNLFAALVGGSGGGKGAATSVAEEGARFPHGDLFYSTQPGSAEGMVLDFGTKEKDEISGEVKVNRTNDSVLFDVREITDLAGQVGRAGSVLSGQLLRAFSGEALGFSYVGNSGVKIPAHEYRFVMLAGVQPRSSEVLLGGHTTSAGLPQRFIWAMASNPDAPDFSLEALDALPVTLNLPRWEPGPQTVAVDDRIKIEIGQQHVLRLRGAGEALDGHAMFVQLKVAAALAFMRGSTRVEMGDWGIASDLMYHSERARRVCLDALEAQRVEQARTQGRGQGIARAAASDAEAEAKSKRVTDLRRLILDHWEDQGRPSRWAPVRRKIAYRSHADADLVAMDLAREIPGFPASDLDVVA